MLSPLRRKPQTRHNAYRGRTEDAGARLLRGPDRLLAEETGMPVRSPMIRWAPWCWGSEGRLRSSKPEEGGHHAQEVLEDAVLLDAHASSCRS
jgi:hypothetical protein